MRRVQSFVDANGEQKVRLETASGATEVYDYVIMACHTDTALDILRAGGIMDEEERILSSFKWNNNEVVLHYDTKLLPKNRELWSCWNYLTHTIIDKAIGKPRANVDEISA